jgi:hypothetical protein
MYSFPTCLVRPSDALTEYAAIVAYAVFHLAQLVDIRDIRFICYPRTCGGECEPLRPSNFSAGGKYEHCRAYELVQRESPSIPPAAEVYHNGNC